MLFSKVMCKVACLALATAATAKSLGNFYAYGSGLDGVELFYADGIAYLGDVPPPGAKIWSNVTFSNNSTYLDATPTNSSVSDSWKTPAFFIDQTSGAFEPAGFTTDSNTTVTTTGFDLFGTLLVWKSSDGQIESKWWAVPTSLSKLFVLKWNVDNVVEPGAVPIALKNIRPSTK